MPKIVQKIPFDENGDMIRTTRYEKKGEIIWLNNGPIQTSLILVDWGWTNTAPYYRLKVADTEKLVYMFFQDFMAVVFFKEIKDQTIFGTWIGTGHAGVYGLRMHASDPDCPKNYDTWAPLAVGGWKSGR